MGRLPVKELWDRPSICKFVKVRFALFIVLLDDILIFWPSSV
jgi:hypothetical protein